MEFEYPLVLILLILVFWCVVFCPQKYLAIYFPNLDLVKNSSKSSNLLNNFLKFLIPTLLIIAIASPITKKEIIIDNSKGYEISLIIDASGSMAQFDKFKIVKEIVIDFIDKRKTDKLALSIFADFAYIAVPLTYDKKSIKLLLQNIDVGVAGKRNTALYEALFLSSKIYKNSKSKEKIAILLTDGVDNANSVPLEIALKTAKKYQIKVYTIGVGNPAILNSAVLKQIAKETGGEYYNATTKEQISNIYKTIDKLEKSKININKFSKKTYYYQYPLTFGLLLLLFYFVRRLW